MKRATTVFILLFALLGITGFANAGGGCCSIPVSASTTRTPAAAKVATLRIDGMTCGACATAVKQVLKNLNGVKDAHLSFAEKKGVVTYDPAKVTPEEIAKAVTEKLPAYKATVIK